MQNPLESPTNLTTNRCTSNFDIAQNVMQCTTSNISSSTSQLLQHQQPSSSPPTITESYYTTQSLTTPMKGIIPKLQHEESKGIPIPGRAQSHDDIRMLGAESSYGSPNSNYGLSPNSPRGQYMYGGSPNSTGFNASPPNRSACGSYSSTSAISGSGGGGVGNNMTARRAISRAASPLSSSVPCNINTTGIMASKARSSTSNSRYIAVSKNCSRSDQMCTFHMPPKKKHTCIHKTKHNNHPFYTVYYESNTRNSICLYYIHPL